MGAWTGGRRQFLRMAVSGLTLGGLALLPPRPLAAGAFSPAAMGRGVRSANRQAPVLSWLAAILRLVPDMPATRQGLSLNDLAAIRAQAGLIRLPESASLEDFAAYVNVLRGAGLADPPFIAGLDAYARYAWERRAEIGFHVGTIDQTATAGMRDDLIDLIRGEFDQPRIDWYFAGCDTCGPLERPEIQGAAWYSWGEDGVMDIPHRLTPPVRDQVGRTGRWRVTRDHITRTVSTAPMVAAVETELGTHPSLADSPDVFPMVSGLADLGAFAAFLTEDVGAQRAPDWLAEQQAAQPRPPDNLLRAATEPSLVLRPYEAAALGNIRHGDAFVMGLVLRHRTPEDASTNADRLVKRVHQVASTWKQQPWRELFDEVEARVDGVFMLAQLTVRGAGKYRWLDCWVQRDSLLLWQ